jgi:hypothetical protein
VGSDSYARYTHKGRKMTYCRTSPSFFKSGHSLPSDPQHDDYNENKGEGGGEVRGGSDDIEPQSPFAFFRIRREE